MMQRSGRGPLILRLALQLPIAVTLAVALAVVPVGATPLDQELQRQVTSARKVTRALGFHVVELAPGKGGEQEVFSHLPDTPRILASNTKLFTTAAAVDQLGADFTFDTPLLMRGPLYDGVLAGDLAVIGSGDPNISGRAHDADPFAIFRRWGEQLRRRGVTRVRGDLILVGGLFDDQWVHPDWPVDQLDRWYQAPVAALSFSDNCFLVRVKPGAEPGAPALVEQTPDLGLYSVENSAVTTSSRRQHSVKVTREPGSWVFRVTGRIYLAGDPVDKWVSVPDPVAHFSAALRAAMAEAGVAVDGVDRRVEQLPGAVWEQVARHTSDLETTLTVTNHRSQNFYAESLVKLLGARAERAGGWPAGLRAVQGFLQSIGLQAGAFTVADGSGLSRSNYATPRQLTWLLSYMHGRDDRDVFLRSLPASGEPMTSWNRRLDEDPYRGKVLAKTGTLRGVSTLSGYVESTSGRLYAFSMLFNETPAVWKARRAQDRLLMALIDHG